MAIDPVLLKIGAYALLLKGTQLSSEEQNPKEQPITRMFLAMKLEACPLFGKGCGGSKINSDRGVVCAQIGCGMGKQK